MHDQETNFDWHSQVAGAKTILVDVDGVLVRSIDAHASCWTDIFVERGYPVTFQQMRELFGSNHAAIVKQVTGLTGPRADAILHARRALFHRIYAARTTVKPGATDLLQKWRDNGARLVALSSSEATDLDDTLQAAGLAHFFDAKVACVHGCETLVKQGLKGTQKSDNGRTLMIGSVPRAVAAAARAGVRMIALRSGGWDDEALAGAWLVQQSSAALLSAFRAAA